MMEARWLALTEDAKWVLYGLAVVTMAYIVLRPFMRRKKDPLEKAPQFGLSQQRAVEREMSNVLVQLSEMARQVTGQLDTRAAKLEALMDEADRKIEELKRLTAGSEGQSDFAAKPATAAREPAAVDPRHREVYALADQGRSVGEIARQLGRPQGEVELILALRMR
jgi:hypothetical protein